MGSSFSRSDNKIRHRTSIEIKPTQSVQTLLTVEERTRTFSISPDDWSNKHFSKVVAFLKEKYPNAHVTLKADKADNIQLHFERPLSFEEGDIHIVVVYDAGTERIMGFYDGANPVG
jgi:hypothetical protein